MPIGLGPAAFPYLGTAWQTHSAHYKRSTSLLAAIAVMLAISHLHQGQVFRILSGGNANALSPGSLSDHQIAHFIGLYSTWLWNWPFIAVTQAGGWRFSAHSILPATYSLLQQDINGVLNLSHHL